jgi:hypothetical protein
MTLLTLLTLVSNLRNSLCIKIIVINLPFSKYNSANTGIVFEDPAYFTSRCISGRNV